MKKPVPKRKGYAEGGHVLWDDDRLGKTYEQSGKTAEQTKRYVAARNAETSAFANERGVNLQDRKQVPANSDDEITPLTRANYPGFAKGGKVKSAIKKAIPTVKRKGSR